MNTNVKKSQAITTSKAYADKRIKVMRFIGMVLIAAIILMVPVSASANYGEKGGTWVLEQIFWVALVVVAIVFIKFFLAGNFTKMLITGGVGALVLYIVANPQQLKTVGEAIWSAAGLGG